jgi:hypothetical protein
MTLENICTDFGCDLSVNNKILRVACNDVISQHDMFAFEIMELLSQNDCRSLAHRGFLRYLNMHNRLRSCGSFQIVLRPEKVLRHVPISLEGSY